MRTKQNFFQYIEVAQGIIESFAIPDSGLADLAEQIRRVELIVPVVGSFSAGKSTLINSFLGSNILPTAITPETALATELRYSEEDYIEAVTAQGAVEKHALSDFIALKDNARNFKLLRVYLNNANLQAIHPLVLVDMPGFDAPIENHNQAILSYLDRGVYFVFLTSVEDGNITVSMKREMENLYRFSKGFSFCISKTNLRPTSSNTAVREKIAEQLEEFFDYTGEVVFFDQNGGENLKKILTAINPETLFSDLFRESLRDNYGDLLQSLNVKLSTFKNSKQEATETMQALQQSITELMAKKSAAISKIESRYSGRSIENITGKVVRNLMANKERLVDLALQNPDAFSREINDLVKNSLLATVQDNLTDIGSNIIQDFSDGLQSNLHNSLILDNNFIGKISQATEKLLHQARGGLEGLAGRLNKRADTGKGKGKTTYRTIATVVGLTTSIVSPLLEVLIVFLPDIIGFLTKEARVRKAREQIEQQLVNQIIPSIRSKIAATLPAVFNERVNGLIEEVGSCFEEQLEQKHAEIEQAATEKQQRADEIAQEIAALETAKRQLDAAANRYLFA